MSIHAVPDFESAARGRLAKAELEGGGISPIQAVLRRKWMILAFGVLAAAAMNFYARSLPSRYVSEVSVALDLRQLRVINAESLLTKELLDREQLRTEMESLYGIGLAREVVSKLALNTYPEFCATKSGLFAAPSSETGTCHASVDDAARLLLARITPRTDPTSYVVYIGATANSPELAARIANAYGAAFVADRQRNIQDVGIKATNWLAIDAARLGRDVAEADAALARYKAAHDLAPLRGETLTSQTLMDMNAALTQVTEEIAQKRSAVAQMQAAAQTRGASSVDFPAGEAPLLHELLAKAAALEDQESRLRSQLGVQHPDYLAARSEAQQLAAQVDRQVARATAGANSELAALEQRRAALQAKVDRLKGQVGTQEQEDVELDALRRDAESKRQIYQSVLSRRMELEAQNGIQQPDARIVSEALPPVSPSEPHRTMMVVGAFLAACGVGSVLAFPAAMLSSRFRDIEHIEEEAGLPVLGIFPRPPPSVAPHDIINAARGSPEAEMILRILPSLLRPADAPAERPPGLPGRCLVVTSALPGEGKTSFAVSLGRAAAELGRSVVLIDGDLRRPSVARLLASTPPGNPSRKPTPPSKERALIDREAAPLDERQPNQNPKHQDPEQQNQGQQNAGQQDAGSRGVAPRNLARRAEPPRDGARGGMSGTLQADPQSQLAFMSLLSGMAGRPRFICGQEIGVLFRSLARTYDLVIIDAPPLLLLADALTLATAADGVLLVVDCHAAPRRAVASAVQLLDRQGADILGAVTSKVDLRRDRQAVAQYFYNDPNYFRRPTSGIAV
jgi:uncharacterized protein involved in exopolysaccharide biosynthesis/Mrp family chromosome partitioning ATPase